MIRSDIEKMSDKERFAKIRSRHGRRLKRRQAAAEKDGNASDCSSDGDYGIETKYSNHLLMNSNKRAMIITSRVHPGETQSSYALEGMVKYLLSSKKRAVELRKNYIFYVVPMLNPDGVIQGNHRTDLLGFDMNRRWAEPSPWLHPIMFAVRTLATIIKEERPIDVFCDIHGHF